MNSIYRRLGGLAIALLMVPVLIGLLACMPVPIGNPERSRIDPQLSGHWLMVSSEEVMLAVFEPYDKRTWLVRLIGLEPMDFVEVDPAADAAIGNDVDDDVDDNVDAAVESDDEIQVEVIVGDDIDIDIETDDAGYPTYESVVGAMTEDIEGDDSAYYKVWRTKLGKYWYLTWEIKGEKNFEPEEWLVFRLDKGDSDRFDLSMLVDSDELFGDVPETRRAYERVIRKNQDDPRLFGIDPEDDTDEAMMYKLYRIAEEDMSRFTGAL